MSTPSNHYTLDARRFLCPMPVIKTQDKVKTLNKDDQLTVYCTDPGVMHDIPAWCKINGHHVESAEKIGNDYIIVVRVGE